LIGIGYLFFISSLFVLEGRNGLRVFKTRNGLSGLLLLYSSLGDAEGISKLATLAKEEGKNNVAFLCLFMLGKLEDCLQLLVERYYSIVVIFY